MKHAAVLTGEKIINSQSADELEGMKIDISCGFAPPIAAVLKRALDYRIGVLSGQSKDEVFEARFMSELKALTNGGNHGTSSD